MFVIADSYTCQKCRYLLSFAACHSCIFACVIVNGLRKLTIMTCHIRMVMLKLDQASDQRLKVNM